MASGRQLPQDLPSAGDLLTSGEVAAAFRVDPKTVIRWAEVGWLSSLQTPGGHWRFRAAEVWDLLSPGDGEPGPRRAAES